MTFGASGRIFLLSNEIRLRSNKAVFKSGKGAAPLVENTRKVQKSTLEKCVQARPETAPGFSLDGHQTDRGAQQIPLGMPNTTYAWCNL